ncbi:MAG: phosphonate transport system substrate-binding protein [Oleiphilaceae bacterium]|jgi:phosphonate transport system substrate-binding protein
MLSHQASSETLYLGSIGDDADEEIKEFLSLANHLKKHLKKDGIDDIKTVVASNQATMANLISSGKVHIYIDSPFPSLIMAKETGSTIFLRRWKNGVAEYHSVIFSRKDSGINSLNAITGKIVAFEDSFSTSSYFLPKTTLLEKGFTLEEVSLGSKIDADKVGYLFSDDDRNTMLWVLRKKVPVGAMNKASFEKYAKKKIKDLQIIGTSISVPRHVVSHSTMVSQKHVSRIKEILTKMHLSKEGKAALASFSKTKQFDDLPGGVNAYLKPLQTLLKYK